MDATLIRLPVRPPFDGDALLGFLAARAVTGVEYVQDRCYARTLRLPAGTGTVRLTFPASTVPAGPPDPAVPSVPAGRPVPAGPPVPASPSAPTALGTRSTRIARTAPEVLAEFRLTDPADLQPAIERCRRLLDADSDPAAVSAVLGRDPALAAAVRARPGLRVPGAVDGPEIAFRAMVGQQISVAAARTTLARLARLADERANLDDAALTHLFPSATALAALGPDVIGGPRRRAAAIVALAEAIADGRLQLDGGRDTAELTAELVARPGIGPWTAGYVAMRVLGDADVLLIGDLALRQGAAALGLSPEPAALARHAERWRPFRSYAGLYLWQSAPTRARGRAARGAGEVGGAAG